MIETKNSGVYYGTRLAWSEIRTRPGDRESLSTLVLLHGSPGTRHDWCHVVDALDGNHRVIAVDRPGYGEAGPASPSAVSIWGNARAIGALIEQVSPEGAIVAGYSHAGGIAIAIASARPSMVRGLVLVSSIGSPDAVLTSDLVTAAPLLGGAFSYLLLRVIGVLTPGIIARLAAAAGPSPSRDEVKAMLGRSLAPRRVWKTYVREERSMVENAQYLEARLGTLKVPTIVFAGVHDTMVPLKASAALASAIPGARLEVFEKTGHSIPIERPRKLARALDQIARELEISKPDAFTAQA